MSISEIFGIGLAMLTICRLGLLPALSTTISLSAIPLGKVVSVGGMKFVKIGDNQYLAAATHDTMQGWDGCASLPNPACMAAGTCTTTTTKSQLFTQGPILMDTRDGKKYEIRKFPDGKCWMVDNLRYGGATSANGSTDYCATKTSALTYGVSTSSTNLDWYGHATINLYGDCVNAQATGVKGTVPAPCLNTNLCGYYYNWQAAMQLSCNANCAYTMPTPTANFIQGICPAGWHLPAGGFTSSESEFIILDLAVGGDGNHQASGHAYDYFWKSTTANTVTSTDPWKGIYSGFSYADGTVVDQYNGLISAFLTARSTGSNGIQHVTIRSTGTVIQDTASTSLVESVRCIKD